MFGKVVEIGSVLWSLPRMGSIFWVLVKAILAFVKGSRIWGTGWTLTKRLEKKLDGNYTRMLRAILNKSWRQHPTRHQLYGHLPPITKTIQVRRTRHAGHCWRSSYVKTQDVTLKTCQRRWMIGRSGERGSGISVLAARHDDDTSVGFILNVLMAGCVLSN